MWNLPCLVTICDTCLASANYFLLLENTLTNFLSVHWPNDFHFASHISSESFLPATHLPPHQRLLFFFADKTSSPSSQPAAVLSLSRKHIFLLTSNFFFLCRWNSFTFLLASSYSSSSSRIHLPPHQRPLFFFFFSNRTHSPFSSPVAVLPLPQLHFFLFPSSTSSFLPAEALLAPGPLCPLSPGPSPGSTAWTTFLASALGLVCSSWALQACTRGYLKSDAPHLQLLEFSPIQTCSIAFFGRGKKVWRTSRIGNKPQIVWHLARLTLVPWCSLSDIQFLLSSVLPHPLGLAVGPLLPLWYYSFSP